MFSCGLPVSVGFQAYSMTDKKP